jgi:hypothetical protein
LRLGAALFFEREQHLRDEEDEGADEDEEQGFSHFLSRSAPTESQFGDRARGGRYT